MTLQGGDCNVNLRTLGILNLEARWGPLGGAGLEFGIWELAVPAKVASLQGALGAGIGIGNLGISSLRRALGPGIGIGTNLGISSLRRALGAGIGIGNLGISSLQGARITIPSFRV